MRTEAKRVETMWHLHSEMPPLQQQSRINLAELKAQIVKKIGPDRADKYFGHLTKLLSRKLNKVDFDKLCYMTIGKENIGLHNHFIRSIFRNAHQAKVPPPRRETFRFLKGVERKPNSAYVDNDDVLAPPIWCNGDPFAVSPRKGRSGGRDRRSRDRSSLFRPTALQGVVMENGHSKSPDLSRPSQLISASGVAELPETGLNSSILPQLKRPRLKVMASPEQVSEALKVEIEVVDVEDEEVVEKVDDGSTVWVGTPLRAPLGIPFCPGSVGSARKLPCGGLMSRVPPTLEQLCLDSSELPDTETVRRQMEHLATAEGLQGVTVDCANLLNHGLDAFLNRLIKSCIDLKGRPGHKQQGHALCRQVHCKFPQNVISVSPCHSVQAHNTCTSINAMQKEESRLPFSFRDFKMAMELHPQHLGEDWPLQLEKISFCFLDQE
eukprot:Gb_32111 [translate_table: standard]